MIGAILQSLRPRQWVENLSVLVAPVFSRRILEVDVGLRAFAAVATFCLIASGVYLMNDLADRKRDALHPEKRRRPIAAGRLDPRLAGIASALFIAGSLLGGWFLGRSFALFLLVYVVVQIAYSLGLRQVVILDVFCIAAGFVIRVLAGGAAVDVPISSWLILTTIFLSLFLALGKRRAELEALSEDSGSHRETLRDYDPRILDQLISVTTASVVLCYALYTLDPVTVEKFGTRSLVLTVPLVIFGVFRYLFLLHRRSQGGEPSTTLLKDLPLAVCTCLWAALVMVIVYLEL